MNNLEKIIIIGCSGHGRVVSDIVQKEGRFQMVGFLDDLPAPGNSLTFPVLGRISDLPALRERLGISGGIVAVGDNWTRGRVVDSIRESNTGFDFVTAIHPSAQIGSGVMFGQGTVVMPGSVINSGSQVGDFCILNTRCSLDHDCRLGSYASLAPGATIGGDVSIGKYTAVCLGANVIHGIEIGAQSVVGAGAVVTKSLPYGIVAKGVPARAVRTRSPDERYL